MNSATGKPNFIGRRPPEPRLRRAAQYVRMSADHQRYSIASQKAAIAEYAALHAINIVRTYADEGRSGLTMKGREALKQLISDAQGGRADFDVILVYDVSRWGRFQDADESAYYEFICKSAGISVIYCAELFENNGSIIATLIKVMKRAMAHEYSRELSAKIARAHKRHAELGFHQGGPPNFGLRRFLVDTTNQPKMLLKHGEAKSLHGDRVILVKGPDDETETVREIFKLFTVERMPHKQIARHLNKKGLRNRRGNPWTNFNINNMLRNEKYAGTFVYGQTSWPMLGGRTENPPERWVRVENKIEPVVNRETFEAAQRLLKDGWTYTDNELLDFLTAAWCFNGYLSAPRLNKNKFSPTPVTYRERFGTLTDAYRLIGYRPVHAYRYSKAGEHIRRTHRSLICRLTSTVHYSVGKIMFSVEKQVLLIDGSIAVAVVVLPYLPRSNTVLPGWKLYFDRLEKCDAVLIARMEKSNNDPLDYFLLPRNIFSLPAIRFTETTVNQFARYKLRSLAGFYRASKKLVSQGICGGIAH